MGGLREIVARRWTSLPVVPTGGWKQVTPTSWISRGIQELKFTRFQNRCYEWGCSRNGLNCAWDTTTSPSTTKLAPVHALEQAAARTYFATTSIAAHFSGRNERKKMKPPELGPRGGSPRLRAAHTFHATSCARSVKRFAGIIGFTHDGP